MRQVNYVLWSVLMGTLQAQPVSVAALMKNSPFQDAAPAVLCDGKLLFQYGVQELRKISGYSENVLFVWRQDGTALLSKKLFDAALSAIIQSKPFSLGARERIKPCRTIKSCYYEYILQEDGNDAAVIAYNSVSEQYSVIGFIEMGKSLLFGLEAIQISCATSDFSFPHVSWDMVAYSYASAIRAAKAHPMIDQRKSKPFVAAYAYGCAIGYDAMMGMRKFYPAAPLADTILDELS